MGLEPDIRCFSLRRVNPFLGVVAVVKTSAARALSVDGLHWQIQILAHPRRVLDPELIQRARVEARLRRSAA